MISARKAGGKAVNFGVLAAFCAFASFPFAWMLITMFKQNNDLTDANHNPFLYYTDIASSITRCSRIVDANPSAIGYLALPTTLITDLNSTTTSSNYMWLTPNTCDDGHTLCAPLNNTVTQVNDYLSQIVPKILNSTIFKSQQAALLITWDEASSKTPNKVTAIWAGNPVKTSYKSLSAYDHYSTARTIETAWNLPTLTGYDSKAKPMTEFFLP